METKELFEFDQPSTIVHTGKPSSKVNIYRTFMLHQTTRLAQLLAPLVQLLIFHQLNMIVC